MKLSLSFLSALLLAAPAFSASVWAPGVSADGGWVDYNKAGSEDSVWGDTGMCWAAAASNVIAWWQMQNSQRVFCGTPTEIDVWKTYKAVFLNTGGTPAQAFNWWIDGTLGSYMKQDSTVLSGKDDKEGNPGLSWKSQDGGRDIYASQVYAGGFLRTIYSSSDYPVSITNSKAGAAAYSKAVIDALSAGYALTLCTSVGSSHAFSLWGVEYDFYQAGSSYNGTTLNADTYYLTKIYVTDADDDKAGNDIPYLADYEVIVDGDRLKFDYAGGLNYFYLENVDGMRSEPVAVPESTTATLSLLALAGLTMRRRRE